ncbi:hypothetical protein BRARA_C00314 [Brassica rapa]|uniref:Uncharacterized protein n=1 Tax=Brassica campestris TaxID=3711 RepID=A0A397ZZ46_BRACM|nr:uncharacterized protein LOC103855744 [Brassica rapa]XP_009131010.1 uncharacterized protein LOC103855744 [Brassica rapa]XP_009131011.1 uncharacterized protein LOC103855744 [Brassica rapa]XP_009131012.1 uncharacterized protein LOC103855744 [Brassica rapa]XP_013680398.2 uncharacterized protein LOC106385010 [Brassica napus]XP_013680399.2 uncharacterized protein LOC106385010 [Brassica napus]XP_013680401.2 uncharacterized protein LOC106385010 [Brassica napus]XP_033142820.1 uncharacterized prote
MQHDSFFLGCNHLNRDITTDARTGYRLYPVQDIDSVLSNVNVDDTFSALCGDLYVRQLKETMKHTMLVQESVFESQIHELHRLYQRQKELMMEMEGTRQHEEALYLNSSVPSLTTHWMSSNVSIYQTRNFPYEENIPNQTEAADNVKKPEKMVLDLELPVLECHDGEEETSLMNGEVANSLESGSQSNKLQFDLNEPAETEEDYQFLSPVSSNESDKKNEGEGRSVKGSCWMYEAQGYGIDLNMSPLSSLEEVNVVVKKLGAEKPQECLSGQSRELVQALPCLNSTLLLNKPHDSYKPRKKKKKKKVKLGPVKKTFKGSDLDLHSSAQATTDKGTKVVGKKKRKKSRRICLVKEGNYKEISAAEAMVDMSRKSDREASDFITYISRKNLLMLAEVSSLVVGGYELDYSEATTGMNLEDHKRILRSNTTAVNKTSVSSIVLKKQKRSYVKGKRNDDLQGTFSECEASEEDLQVKVDEVSGQEGDCEFPKKKRRSSLKRTEDFTWGAKSKRRRVSRIPAVDFQHMIINQ